MKLNINDELKKIFLAGIGAISMTYEKGQELVSELVKKGDLSLQQGKVLNEELKRKAQDTAKKVVNKIPVSFDQIINKLDNLSKEELEELKKKLAEKEDCKNNDNEEVKDNEEEKESESKKN